MLNRIINVAWLRHVWAAASAGATQEHGAKRTPKHAGLKLNIAWKPTAHKNSYTITKNHPQLVLATYT